MNKLFLVIFFLLALGCQSSEDTSSAEVADSVTEPATEAVTAQATTNVNSLDAVLMAQPDETKARYIHRHPGETLEFFGIEPGMTVVEGLPGGGWYSRILLPYLGKQGHLIGVNYALDMWPNFSFASEEFMAGVSQWLDQWPGQAAEWGDDNNPQVSGFWFGSLSNELANSADVVFFPRVLHNLARFQAQGISNYLDVALADAYTVLKPGGIFGVVQHHARDDMSDEWANGSNGYLKKQFVIEQVEKAGFEFVGESNINANAKDQPTAEEIVWRLPPSLATSREDAELRAKYEMIGESNRMTLKFRKPK